MEKKNESLGIYYLIIIFLIIMIIIPPLFRYTMPNPNSNKTNKNNTTQNTTTNNNNNTNNNINNNTNNNVDQNTNTVPTSGNTLSCILDEEYLTYNITTKYNSEKISDLNFSYTIKKQMPTGTPTNNMFTIINNLRTVKGASVQENTDKVGVEFYLEGVTTIQDELKLYTQEKTTQKASYEALGFKCTLD